MSDRLDLSEEAQIAAMHAGCADVEKLRAEFARTKDLKKCALGVIRLSAAYGYLVASTEIPGLSTDTRDMVARAEEIGRRAFKALSHGDEAEDDS